MADTTKAAAAKPEPKAEASDAEQNKPEAGVDFPKVDPETVPAEIGGGHRPEGASKESLLAAAQAKAPSLTQDFVDAHDFLDDDMLAKIARGEEPPPPTVKRVPAPGGHAVTDGELHLTPGGWQITPKGVSPDELAEQVQANAR